ncbi:ester cyclase [Lichenibacterium ramalinae]|uniref:Ester cyclase n=1 Tax=Lichenibacterium ramalinae TaxID=2316527 RepID=A0A4Q2RBG1_9HYPH|nr:ester cyclase [Lichenibacterium ramalinae]RYB02258.1 ester cyclase [Lichenibacterium ramalinae]
MTPSDLAELYRAYIACLNARDWARLDRFVGDAVVHHPAGRGLATYRAMLERDVAEIPDLRFEIGLLVAEPPHVAARLLFDCTPKGRFLGLPVDGRRVAFAENVIYRFADGRIAEVWSLVDRGAIERQLATPAP